MFFLYKKKIMNRILAIVLAGAGLFLFGRPVYAAQVLSLYATGAVLMDADTGRVLYEKNSSTFLANASTTKILTCILALENASLDESVETSAYAAGMPKVKLYMKQGEHFKLGDLLYSLMLESHNDTAVAIAEHVGGSLEEFAAMMNTKAREIGCDNSWFITPNGLDATQNYTDNSGNIVQLSHGTTAEDLARIMAYCCFESNQSKKFLEITQTPSYAFQSMEGRSFSCVNHNAFLQMMEGVISGKTGFTSKAGYCYVGCLERDGKRFTIALLGCGWPNNKTYKWKDSKTLFTYGLENFEYHSIDEVVFDESILNPVLVKEAQTEYLNRQFLIPLEVKEGSFEGLLLSKDEQIVMQYRVADELTAPVKQGEPVGYIRYMLGEICLREDIIVTKEEALQIDFEWCFQKVLEHFLID